MEYLEPVAQTIGAWPIALQWLIFGAAFAILSIPIAKVCERFEDGSNFLGNYYKMPDGTRGATIDAICSSLPEFFSTAWFFLFAALAAGGVAASQGISAAVEAAVSLSAGSAVFNIVIIPAAVILCTPKKEGGMQINKKPFLRDALWLIVIEAALIVVVGQSTLHWWHGAILCLMYLGYVGYLTVEHKRHNNGGSDTETADDDDEDDEESEALTVSSAWKIIAGATAAIVVLCMLLSFGVDFSAHTMSISIAITGLTFGAVASSVPDTLISMASARRGKAEDAIANPMGSNIFDIAVCFGFWQMIVCLINGPIEMAQDQTVQLLRIVLVVITALVALIFLIPRTIQSWMAYVLCTVFVGWIVIALNTQYNWFELPFVG